jgi:hypothetical protein
MMMNQPQNQASPNLTDRMQGISLNMSAEAK